MSFVDAGAIDAAAVGRLVARQFPEWADRAVTALPFTGAGNALFRLGDDLLVRLPRHPGAVAAIDVALTWLPQLAAQLPLAVPVPVAAGAPDEIFPRPWAVFRWLRGASLAEHDVDPPDLAVRLGQFVAALHTVGISGAPSSLRPNPLDGDDSEVRDNIGELDAADEILATAVWERALAAPSRRRVWVHGDLFPMNLVADRGRLSAVIDFDLTGVGDPAIDMLPAWALLSASTRPLFRETCGVDDDTWIRGRGYALAAALGSMRKYRGTAHPLTITGPRILAQTIADYQRA